MLRIYTQLQHLYRRDKHNFFQYQNDVPNIAAVIQVLEIFFVHKTNITDNIFYNRKLINTLRHLFVVQLRKKLYYLST